MTTKCSYHFQAYLIEMRSIQIPNIPLDQAASGGGGGVGVDGGSIGVGVNGGCVVGVRGGVGVNSVGVRSGVVVGVGVVVVMVLGWWWL